MDISALNAHREDVRTLQVVPAQVEADTTLRLPRAPSQGLAMSLERRRLQFYLFLVLADMGILLGSFALVCAGHCHQPDRRHDRTGRYAGHRCECDCLNVSVVSAEHEFPTHIAGSPLAGKSVLIVVENLPLPFDRRVWQEARTLKAAGATVSVICPKGKGYEKSYEEIEGVHIHRHSLPIEADGALGFLLEYGAALFWETVLAWKIYFKRGIDVIQGCNPPDLIFLVALPFKLLGVKYIFDHHDINPELYEAKFGKRGFFWRLMVLFEKLTFKVADVSMATNQSYRAIAIARGGMDPDKVFVVRSGPDLSRLRRVEPAASWRTACATGHGASRIADEQRRCRVAPHCRAAGNRGRGAGCDQSDGAAAGTKSRWTERAGAAAGRRRPLAEEFPRHRARADDVGRICGSGQTGARAQCRA